VLADLAGAVSDARRPRPFPAPGTVPLPDARANPILYQRLVRLARQLRLMHDAVERWMTGNAAASPVTDSGAARRQAASTTAARHGARNDGEDFA
jgi:hypothetical protein